MTNQPILTRLARLMHRLRLRSPATEAEKREWAAIRQAASVAGSAHTLRIISLDDAQAECLAGDWHLSVTGPQTRGQIETEFAQHRPADHSVPVATDRCECADSGCKAAPWHQGDGVCSRAGEMHLFRIDMGDTGPVVFCEPCGDDALDSGVFLAGGDAQERLDSDTAIR